MRLLVVRGPGGSHSPAGSSCIIPQLVPKWGEISQEIVQIAVGFPRVAGQARRNEIRGPIGPTPGLRDAVVLREAGSTTAVVAFPAVNCQPGSPCSFGMPPSYLLSLGSFRSGPLLLRPGLLLRLGALVVRQARPVTVRAISAHVGPRLLRHPRHRGYCTTATPFKRSFYWYKPSVW